MRAVPVMLAIGVTTMALAQNGLAPVPEAGGAFMKAFAGLCMRRVGDLEVLRQELKAGGVPALEEPMARVFLEGRPGDAWPVPDDDTSANLVLALPSDRPECSLFARHGSAERAEAEFSVLAGNAPPPLVAELKTDRRAASAANGDLHTLGYLWRLEGNPIALAFFLTTASGASAPIQLKATATRVSAP